MTFGEEQWGGKWAGDYARKAQASELTLVCWSRKGSLGPGNPRYQRSGTVGERYDPSCRIDLQGIEGLANSKETTFVPKGRQRDEGG